MEWKSVALDVFVPILCAMATALSGYAIAWLRKKAQEADLGVWDKAADLILDELDTAVTKLQPLVDEMKAKAKDGKLDAEQVSALKARAIEYVRSELAPRGINVAKTVSSEMLGDWVTHLVESRKGGLSVSAIDRLASPPLGMTEIVVAPREPVPAPAK